jgi:hypothetical protein
MLIPASLLESALVEVVSATAACGKPMPKISAQMEAGTIFALQFRKSLQIRRVLYPEWDTAPTVMPVLHMLRFPKVTKTENRQVGSNQWAKTLVLSDAADGRS